jgi:polyisoprenoid-binding protein YceI
MTMRTKILTLAFVFAFSWGMAQDTWIMDKDHTEIKFNVTHLIISEVSGNFKAFDGQVISSGDDFDGAEIQFTADVASIDTDNEKRDNHLKSEDFFAAELYPHVKFSGKLVKNGDGYQLKGDFTMRDVTNPVVFDVKYNGTITDPWGNEKAGFKITGAVDRFDYGLNWNNLMETGGAVVGKEVEIVCNVQLQKQS